MSGDRPSSSAPGDRKSSDLPPIAPPHLAENRLRTHLRGIIDQALDSVSPEALLAGTLGPGATLPDGPTELGTLWAEFLSGSSPLRVIAFGKAAPRMTRGLLATLPLGREAMGIVLAPAPSPPDPGLPRSFRQLTGGHPLPTVQGAAATREIIRILEDAGPDDPVVVLVSGGGSALLALPQPGITIDDLRATTSLLLLAGASISEVNTVRKHLEVAKAGGLARTAFPAPVLALVISDVLGDPLEVIASGPLAPDPTTFGDALDILARRELLNRVPSAVRRHLSDGAAGLHPETPGAGNPVFERVRTIVVGNLAIAAEAAAAAARRLGYRTHVPSLSLTGEARAVGRRLGALARSLHDGRDAREVTGARMVAGVSRVAGGTGIAGATDPQNGPVCLICGGETTVTVPGHGRGGRNQEVVLGAAEAIAGMDGILIASFGTDGIDGPTDAAGGLATGSTLARGRAAGMDITATLDRNDSYVYLRTLGDLIITGPTGTNVMDLQVILME